MIILGISGYEDIRGPSALPATRHPYGSVEDLLSFAGQRLPLQYFPLHLLGHDCSASLLKDGKLIAFAAEERFSRIKHGLNLAGNAVLPRSAIRFCLHQAGVTWDDIDHVAHFCNFDISSVQNRIALLSYNLNAEQRRILGEQCLDNYNNCLSTDVLMELLSSIGGRQIRPDVLIPVRHHLAHAAGAFFSSGFRDALILTVDGFGEEESSLVACGRHNTIDIIDRVQLPTSLGLLYQVVTAYLGFKSFGDEYKVMGLSSYGNRKRYREVFHEFVRLKKDGRYEISHITSPILIDTLKGRFGDIVWQNGFSQKAADIAAALQDTLEVTLLHTLTYYQKSQKARNLCLSGGVALNAVANGVIKRSGLFEQVYIQPAAADDGTSLGAALYVDRQRSNGARESIGHTYWGPGYRPGQIRSALNSCRHVRWSREADIARKAAGLLADGRLIGWFQGRMEMGPRALGARSILSDPRRIESRDRLNLMIKNRESFRPFAPAVLEETADRFFILNGSGPDPYMITTVQARTEMRHLIPAVVHVDGTSRLQTVTEKANRNFYRLIWAFYELTGIPMVLNTSFNRTGEPIVCSPEDALNCFMRCGLDALVMENFLVFPNYKTGEDRCQREDTYRSTSARYQ